MNKKIESLKKDIRRLENSIQKFEDILDTLPEDDVSAMVKYVEDKTNAEKLLEQKKKELVIEEANERAKQREIGGRVVSATAVAASTAGAGTVNIRPNDKTSFVKPDGAKTYEEILKTTSKK
jgi:hypothetical protein